MGMPDKPAHGFHHFRSLRGIKNAVVAKNRIHQGKTARSEQIADAAYSDLKLARIAEKTGIYGVELQSHALPVIEHGAHFTGKIMKGEAFHAGSLGRKHCRGQRADLNAHAGENGDDNGEGSPPESGQIVNGGNALERNIKHGMSLKVRGGVKASREPCPGQ